MRKPYIPPKRYIMRGEKMSQTQTQTFNQTKELTNEDIAELVRRALSEGREEARLILRLTLSNRREGCGYIYLFREYIEILEGDADIITLEKYEVDCNEVEKVAVIPKMVPTVVKVTYRDEDPEALDRVLYNVFTPEGWRSIEVILPKS